MRKMDSLFKIRSWWPYLGLIVVLLTITAAAVWIRGDAALEGVLWGRLGHQESEPLKVNLGVYDPERAFANSKVIAVEHYYLSWASFDREDLGSKLQYAADRDRWPLLSIEPWPYNQGLSRTLLADIASGKYDGPLASVCGEIKGFNRPVLVSWGHEMEQDLAERYPWSGADPQEFVTAYRYFVERCNQVASGASIYYVWSPVGNKGLERYWPGDDYVDYVGIAVYSFPEWDREVYGKARSFREIMDEKYGRIERFNKPVVVVEMGVTGNGEYQRQWLEETFRDFDRYPLLRTVVYFNARDREGAWGEGYPTPDWRIDPLLLYLYPPLFGAVPS